MTQFFTFASLPLFIDALFHFAAATSVVVAPVSTKRVIGAPTFDRAFHFRAQLEVIFCRTKVYVSDLTKPVSFSFPNMISLMETAGLKLGLSSSSYLHPTQKFTWTLAAG